MAALDTIACRSGARVVSSCFGVGGSILPASEPDDELTARKKHRRAAIPRSERGKRSGIFLRRHKRGDSRWTGKGRWAARRWPHVVIFLQRNERERERGWEKAKRRECA